MNSADGDQTAQKGLTLYHSIQSFNNPEKEHLLKTFWKKEKMLESSIFSFFQNVFFSDKEKVSYLKPSDLSSYAFAKPHCSFGSMQDLRTGSRWFDLWLSQYSFWGLMIVILTGFIPLLPLPIVLTMVMWESCQWLGKNRELQKSMYRCSGRCGITELLLKTVLNTKQSDNHHMLSGWNMLLCCKGLILTLMFASVYLDVCIILNCLGNKTN